MKKRKYELVEIKNLKPYENNARIHSQDQICKIVKSIKEFGFLNPILIDNDYGIIAGHGRFYAAQKMNLKSIPCIFIDDLTDEQKRAYIIADNQLALDAEWDEERLNKEIQNLFENGFDVEILGFDELNFDFKDIELFEDDYEQDDDSEIKTEIKTGNVYKLGNHVLMCGDSTNLNDVNQLMGNETADLFFSDPPYNVNIENESGMKIMNDCMNNESFFKFLFDAFKNASEHLKLGGAFYIWFASKEHINFENALKSNNLIVHQELIWIKNSFTFGRSDYQWKHEPCLYGWKSGGAHYFIEEFNHTTVIDKIKNIDFEKLSKNKLLSILKEIIESPTPQSTLFYDKPQKDDIHPTMKPVELCGNLIKNSSKENEIVLDLFGGSGSTLIACEQLNRKCRMMEFDPIYVDAIIKRWEEFTGEKALKIQ